MAYVTGAAILTHVGVTAPTAADTAWAGVVAAAIDAAITARIDGDTESADLTAELTRAALQDGAAAYNERRAPHGILTIGGDGDTVRLGADILRATLPVLRRHLVPGLA